MMTSERREIDMINASNAVVWINRETKAVMVAPHCVDGTHHWGRPERHGYDGHWADPIGAAYGQWQEMNDEQRLVLMVETVVDLAMQGFPIAEVVRAFAQVREFRGLGSKSYPMCRALTSALVGECLEPNTMNFEELLEHHK